MINYKNWLETTELSIWSKYKPNTKRIEARVITDTDMSYFNFQDIVFIGVAFQNCNFRNANIAEAVFIDCTFDECDLRNTIWYGTVLNNTGFYKSQLKNADMLSLRSQENTKFAKLEDVKVEYISNINNKDVIYLKEPYKEQVITEDFDDIINN